MSAGQGAQRRSSGRPKGTDSTRAKILTAAREAFAASGYEGASLRTIARQAGVDPSTAVHFFGAKAGLFRAVIEDIAPATEPLVEALRRQAPGAELVTIYLGVWEDPLTGPALRALLRTAISSEEAMDLLRENLIGVLVMAAGPKDPVGLGLAMTHLMGTAMGRYIARLPQLVDADVSDLSARLGPVLDGYLAPDQQVS